MWCPARQIRLVAGLALLLLPAWSRRSDGEPAPDWTRLAREVVDEANRMRRNPAAYAEYLDAMLPRFDGTLLQRPHRSYLRTEEGAAAVREAIRVLRVTAPMAKMEWSPGLALAARDHVRDQGPVGGTQHRGTDGSRPAQRANRHGEWRGAVAEAIAYGENPAREVVLQLLVDDGVPDRGHRTTLLDPGWGHAGAACGPHRDYGQICVVDLAAGYTER